MNIRDRVYGDIDITESTVIDLIKTHAFERLKHIDQAGYSKVFYPGTEQTRFEHSVGVYFLLREFGCPLVEQVAGLLHDISHSAFSHSIDYVFGKTEKDQSHQDNVFVEYVVKSDIPQVLRKYSIPLKSAIQLYRYPLLDLDIPDLSADRLDYSLRTAVAFSWITRSEAMKFVHGLRVHDGHWIFQEYKKAQAFADLFLKLNRELYSGPTSALMFRTVGDCIGYAVKKRYVTIDDLYTTDKKVLEKVVAHLATDDELSLYWKRMNKKTKSEFNTKKYNARVYCKSRVVDPYCYVSGKIRKISDVNSSWKAIVRQELQPKEYFIRFFDTPHQV